jgi:hypothetical protein
MIATRKQTRKQINDLKMDLEIINPIESKTLLGGDWYNELDTVYVYSHGWASGAGTFGGTYDPFYDGSNTSDWYNYDENYGGSGGDSGGNGVYGLPNLPSTVEQQLGSMGACVSYAMSFMSSYLGHAITGANMALHNAKNLNLSVTTTMVTGLSIAESTQAIQSYFNTTTLTTTAQIINAVETNQHGVLVNVFNYDAKGQILPGGHEVAIVDYDPATGTFLAADSNTGGYQQYYQNQINLSGGVYEIIGVKP